MGDVDIYKCESNSIFGNQAKSNFASLLIVMKILSDLKAMESIMWTLFC